MSVRDATPDDVPTLIGLIHALAEYERLSHEADPDPDRLREHLFGDRPCAQALVAEAGGESVGFALYFTSYSTFLTRPGLYLEDLFVLPDHRGHGHGKALLVELARRAVQRGCGRLEWAVLDWNEPSIRFYQSLGAKAMDEWTVNRVTGAELVRLAGLGSSEPRP